MILLPPHAAIGFLLNHTEEVIDYINDVKDANKDQKNLSDKLVATQTVLSQLKRHADDNGWKETMGALCATGGPFDHLTVELKSMENKLKPSTGMFKSGNALAWDFTKAGVKKHFDRIE
jgi:thiamine pyrophosphokinase